jgi:hypothetical protein
MDQRKDRNPATEEDRTEHGGPGREQRPMKENFPRREEGQGKFGEKREPGKFGERRERPREPGQRQDLPR